LLAANELNLKLNMLIPHVNEIKFLKIYYFFILIFIFILNIIFKEMLNFKLYGAGIARSYFKLGLSNFSNKNFSSMSSIMMRSNFINMNMSVQMPILIDNSQNEKLNIDHKIENSNIISNFDDEENISVEMKGRNSKVPKRVNYKNILTYYIQILFYILG
jgi:hypothetical protein